MNINRRQLFAALAGAAGSLVGKGKSVAPPDALPISGVAIAAAARARDEALRFCAGDQWPADVKARRLAMGRPCLVVNMIPGIVERVMREGRLPASEGYRVIEETVREYRDIQMMVNYHVSAEAEAFRAFSPKCAFVWEENAG